MKKLVEKDRPCAQRQEWRYFSDFLCFLWWLLHKLEVISISWITLRASVFCVPHIYLTSPLHTLHVIFNQCDTWNHCQKGLWGSLKIGVFLQGFKRLSLGMNCSCGSESWGIPGLLGKKIGAQSGLEKIDLLGEHFKQRIKKGGEL